MSIVSAWEQRIRHDLAPFVDPSSTLDISSMGNVIGADWIQQRKKRAARFIVRDSEGVYVAQEGRELDYRAFFASEQMADIAGIAQTSMDILSSAIFIETKAESDDIEGAVERPALELISTLVVGRTEEDTLTNFVMVTGEAGAGKTSVLKELVWRQARSYLSGSSAFVYLYVNAQGRALARFNEAVATELNELRVSLPHHAVAPLVKMGLIVPVIDGFDELIGVGGYDDAFSSISSFVQALDGRGAVVASARSTYYEQEFLSRTARNAARSTDAWKLVSVAVRGWGQDERRLYAEAKLAQGQQQEEVQQVLASLGKVFSGENEPLGSKPLFVARTTDFILQGLLKPSDAHGDLLGRLVSAFILREQHEKLLKKDGGSILSGGQILSICSDIAEEMWNLGSRELDQATIREVAEIALSGLSIAAADQSTVIERAPNLAFLQPGDSPGFVGFEHEIFFDYFLSSRIADAVGYASPSLLLLLSRSSMPESLANSVATNLLGRQGVNLKAVLQSLCKVATRPSPRQQLVRENAGQLFASIVSQLGSVDDIAVTDLIFPGVNFHNVKFDRVSIEHCEIRRCDLTSASFVACRAEGVILESPLLDGDTRLEIEGLDVPSFVGIRFAEDNEVRVIYSPQRMTQILKAAGLPVLIDEDVRVRQVSPDVVRLVERLARAYAKCNPICVQDSYLKSIFDDGHWPAVQRAGIEAGIWRTEARAANGPRREFIRRLVRPEDLLAGIWVGADVPDSISGFWRRMESEFNNQAAM